jgi:hypothetical protein
MFSRRKMKHSRKPRCNVRRGVSNMIPRTVFNKTSRRRKNGGRTSVPDLSEDLVGRVQRPIALTTTYVHIPLHALFSSMEPGHVRVENISYQTLRKAGHWLLGVKRRVYLLRGAATATTASFRAGLYPGGSQCLDELLGFFFERISVRIIRLKRARDSLHG